MKIENGPEIKPALFAIEGREIIGGKAHRLWYRKLDSHWTHHSSRVQFYTRTEAETILASLPPHRERVVRIVPATEVPS